MLSHCPPPSQRRAWRAAAGVVGWEGGRVDQQRLAAARATPERKPSQRGPRVARRTHLLRKGRRQRRLHALAAVCQRSVGRLERRPVARRAAAAGRACCSGAGGGELRRLLPASRLRGRRRVRRRGWGMLVRARQREWRGVCVRRARLPRGHSSRRGCASHARRDHRRLRGAPRARRVGRGQARKARRAGAGERARGGEGAAREDRRPPRPGAGCCRRP
jgi:hypothetical protein